MPNKFNFPNINIQPHKHQQIERELEDYSEEISVDGLGDKIIEKGKD